MKETKERNRRLLKGFMGATIAAIVIMSAVANLSGTSSPPNENVVSIEPMSQLVSGNDTFTVNITIDPSQPIRAVGFDISFDSSLINATSVTEGDLFAGYGTAFYNGIIDNIDGTITGVAGTIIGHGNVSSPGNFAIITFTTGNTSGTSLLNLSNVDVQNETESVPTAVNNGSVTIDAAKPIVEVIYPKGGEIISGTATIKWNATDNIANLNGTIWIQYSDDNGTTWNEIASKLNNTGEYDWNTTTVYDGSECLIMVNATDYVNNTGSNESSSIFIIDNTPPNINIEKPKEGYLYIFDREIISPLRTIIIGPITIEADADDAASGIDKVEFYIDDVLNNTDDEAPYEWKWDERAFFKHTIKVIAYDKAGNAATPDEIEVMIFNF